MRRISSKLPTLGLLFVLAGCSSNSAIERSRDFARLADYPHAMEVLEIERERQAAEGDVDPELQAEYDYVKRRFLLDRARRRIFQEREDAALRDLDELAVLDPDFPEADLLRRRARYKQAMRVVHGADEKLAGKDYEGAMTAYIESQRLVPGFAPAAEGIQRVRDELARLSRRAQQQFLQAVRKVPEFRHIEVEWHAASVIHNTPNAEDAKREQATQLRAEARRETARTTMRRALECERDNQFGAALVLYRTALDFDPELEGAEEAITKMERELEATALLDRARIGMRNGQFVEAQELLQDAFEKSLLSRGQISELMIQARELEADLEYRNALDLQIMGKKADALLAFEQLLEKWPGGRKDEEARISSLKIDIEGAKAEWAVAEAAEAAGDLEEALDHYLNAERYYEDWRDGESRIERLRAAIKAKEAAEANESEQGAEGGEATSTTGGSSR